MMVNYILKTLNQSQFYLDDNKIKSSNYSSDLGFGFRAISDEVVAYSHSNEISKESLNNSSKNLNPLLNLAKELIIMKFLKLIINFMKI